MSNLFEMYLTCLILSCLILYYRILSYHFRLRELASPSNPPLYPNIDISDDILSQSLSCFANYVKSKYISSYYVTCNVKDCYTCDNS